MSMPGARPPVRSPSLGTAMSSVRPAAAQDGQRGARDDLDVEPDRPVLDVVEVEPHEVVEVELGAARDLPQTRDAGQHAGTAAMTAVEQLAIAPRRRARPDQGHI